MKAINATRRNENQARAAALIAVEITLLEIRESSKLA
jgi:hypothetical protein